MVDLGRVRVGGSTRGIARFAMHPEWRTMNGDNHLDDVAIVELDAPVTEVAPVPIGRPVTDATIVGRGRPVAPGRRASLATLFSSKLRQATLRPMPDDECARSFGKVTGNGGERLDGRRMLCAIDVDGRAPLSSGCNGDSGGPLNGGTTERPVLVGVVSWGGARCGADRLPSVFADAAHYRTFITDPSPVWAPVIRAPATIAGTPAAGRRLTCAATDADPRRVQLHYRWTRQGGRKVTVVGRQRTHRVTAADAGHELACTIRASNAGGVVSAPAVPSASVVRVRRR
jgi:hypothetical protein